MTGTAPPTDPLTQAVRVLVAAGRADLAGDLVRQSVAPPVTGQPGALHEAALKSLATGRAADAERALRTALRLDPQQAALHDHLGVALAQQRRFAEAEATFALAETLDPADPSPRRNRIQSCLDQKKFAAALQLVIAARDHEPESDDLALLQVVALVGLGRLSEAELVLEPLARVDSPSDAVLDRLGVVKGLAGDAAGAAACFQVLVNRTPTAAGAWANLAAALGKLRRWGEAAEAGKRATELAPNAAGGWANYGNALRDLGRLPEALAALQTAVRLDPTQADSASNLALALAMQGNPQAALPWYDRALTLAPQSAEVRFNRAIALLSLGNFTEGWPEYEWRFATQQMRFHPRAVGPPPWRGESLAGKTILVQCEQGHGDTLQFVRLVPRVAALGATVILLASPLVKRLLETVPGVARVVTADEPLPVVDFVSPLMSLPYLTQLRVDTIPHDVPAVVVPQDYVVKWQSRVKDYSGLKVGIAWQGNPGHVGDRFRSVPVGLFAPLAEVPGVTLLSVQLGAGQEQLAGIPFPVVDLAAEITGDFADTAGLVQHLDLIVTVDSAVAHLAGALARPVWVALPVNADWRWMQTRPDSPWYPTMRLYRQATFGDWPPVFARMAADLRAGRM